MPIWQEIWTFWEWTKMTHRQPDEEGNQMAEEKPFIITNIALLYWIVCHIAIALRLNYIHAAKKKRRIGSISFMTRDCHRKNFGRRDDCNRSIAFNSVVQNRRANHVRVWYSINGAIEPMAMSNANYFWLYPPCQTKVTGNSWILAITELVCVFANFV